MSKEVLIGRLEDLMENNQVTFGYNPKGDEDWFVSVKDLKELIEFVKQEDLE